MKRLKECTRCNGWFDEEDFQDDVSMCVSCACKHEKCHNHIDKYAEAKKKYKKENPEIVMLSAAKRRARGRFEFDISKEDIRIPEFCPLLSIPLRKGIGRLCPNSPTLDRIDNSKGYIKGNVWVISHRANSLKNNGSLRELIQIGKILSQLYPHPTTDAPNQIQNKLSQETI